MRDYLFVDNRMKKIYKDYLKSLGYYLIEIPCNTRLYYEISSHVDIVCTKISDTLILEKSLHNYLISSKDYNLCKMLQGDNVICGNSEVVGKYPFDVQYNLCVIGDNAIHNFRYTDSVLKNILIKNKYNLVNIAQGYSKCSIAVIDENSCIVTDKKIYDTLIVNGIDTLLLENMPDIKLLKKDGTYSNMNGFIGGAMARILDKVVIFGDIKYTKNPEQITKFVRNKNLEIVDFKGNDIIDYGSVVEFKGGFYE